MGYVRLPYLDGHRPERLRVRMGETVIQVEVEGERKAFETPKAYRDFWAEQNE